MDIKKIIGIVLGIVLLNNSLYTLIPLPGIISLVALIGAAILLFIQGKSGGMLSKIFLVVGIIIGIYALAGILGFVGISLPFISIIYRIERLALIAGGILLIVGSFVDL